MTVLTDQVDKLSAMVMRFVLWSPPKEIQNDIYKKAEAFVNEHLTLPLERITQISALNEALASNKLAAALVSYTRRSIIKCSVVTIPIISAYF